jgi:hypothetical protein
MHTLTVILRDRYKVSVRSESVVTQRGTVEMPLSAL